MASAVRGFKIFNLHDSDGELRAIYSVHVHPAGDQIATCGADKQIRIWSTNLLFKGLQPQTRSGSLIEDCKDPWTLKSGMQRLPLLPRSAEIAVLSNHTRVVTCVRWSNNGRYLASGSDDTFGLIWEAAADPHSQDVWTRTKTLRGHTMDVLDLAWRHDDVLLASCSIDNRILIWHVDDGGPELLSPVRVLDGHKSWVKGVAWDPLGKFLASASEDKRVIIWRTFGDWNIEAELTTPFKGAFSQTFFQRLSWSPDGLALGVPNAAKAQQQIAAIISRGAWQSVQADLLGHRHAVTVVCFAPVMFRAEGLMSNNQQAQGHPSTVVAVGSQDATISIWSNAQGRPLCVIRDCFSSSVSDLSWSADAALLIASSHDGSVCAFLISGLMGIGISTNQLGLRACVQRFGGSREREFPRGPGLLAELCESEVETRNSTGKRSIQPVSMLSTRDATCVYSGQWSDTNREAYRVEQRESEADDSSQSPSVMPGARTSRGKLLTGEKRRKLSAPSELENVLPLPKFHEVLTCTVVLGVMGTMQSSETEVVQVEIRQYQDQDHRYKSHGVASSQGELLWQTAFDGLTTAISGCGEFCVVGRADGMILFLDSRSGSMTLPPFLLGAAVCHLACSPLQTTLGRVENASYIAVITADAEIRVWNLKKLTMVTASSIVPAMNSALSHYSVPNIYSSHDRGRYGSTLLSIINCEVNSRGHVRVVFAAGTDGSDGSCERVQAFALDSSIGCWLRVSDSECVQKELSIVYDEPRPFTTLSRTSGHEWEDPCFPGYDIEERLISAATKQNIEEIRYWLRLHAAQLIENGDVRKIRRLWEKFVLSGSDHAEVFRSGLLRILRSTPKFGRLMTELTEMA